MMWDFPIMARMLGDRHSSRVKPAKPAASLPLTSGGSSQRYCLP